MDIVVTGAAGFIGFHVARALLERGERVIGIDELNDYYDPALKQARLVQLTAQTGFDFERADVADRQAMTRIFKANRKVGRVVHLAAQAGVRYSLVNPYAYISANVMGQLVVQEACRGLPDFEHLVYASSSSVYGGNEKLPFAVEDRVDRPVSLYAATKRAGELIAHCQSGLYGLPATGLRFFTVYGPWGRPDMAAFIFTKAIFEGRPIKVFNQGRMRRDFTFIDDIVAGVLAALDRPPKGDLSDEALGAAAGVPHRIYNLGNHRSEDLLHFIEVLERACGREAVKEMAEMQPGDVEATYADIGPSRRDLGFEPRTSIEEGLPRFVAWYRDYHDL